MGAATVSGSRKHKLINPINLRTGGDDYGVNLFFVKVNKSKNF